MVELMSCRGANSGGVAMRYPFSPTPSCNTQSSSSTQDAVQISSLPSGSRYFAAICFIPSLLTRYACALQIKLPARLGSVVRLGSRVSRRVSCHCVNRSVSLSPYDNAESCTMVQSFGSVCTKLCSDPTHVGTKSGVASSSKISAYSRPSSCARRMACTWDNAHPSRER